MTLFWSSALSLRNRRKDILNKNPASKLCRIPNDVCLLICAKNRPFTVFRRVCNVCHPSVFPPLLFCAVCKKEHPVNALLFAAVLTPLRACSVSNPVGRTKRITASRIVGSPPFFYNFHHFLFHIDENLFQFAFFCVILTVYIFLSHLFFTFKPKNRYTRVNGMTRKRKTV